MSPRKTATTPDVAEHLWTERIDWSSLDVETTLPPGHPYRIGRIVPCDRQTEVNGRRINVGELLTVVDAIAVGVIGPDEAMHWRIELHNRRAPTIPPRRVEVSADEALRTRVERQLAAGRNA